MKRKIIKLAVSIIATIVLTPIFVVGIINLPSLFPESKSTIEEVKAYVPRDVNEEYIYSDKKFDYLTDKDKFTYKTEDDSYIENYRTSNLFASTTKFVGWDSNAQDFSDKEFIAPAHGDTFAYLVTGDDPIINLIPRELFNCRGTYLYIGKEWGFFVQTEQFQAGTDDGSNKATVLVFDIKQTQLYNPDKPRDPAIHDESPDMISSSVKVLFQYEYRFLKQNDEGCFGNKKYGKWNIKYKGNQKDLENNGNTLIIAQPQKVEYTSPDPFAGFYRFIESNTYSLTDIVFFKDIMNEQYPDKYMGFGNSLLNTAYVPENDMGNYFIRADYSFSDSEEVVKKLDVMNMVKSYITLSFSFMGPYGTFAGVVAGGFEACLSMFPKDTVIPSNAYDGKLGAQCFYTTKYDQLRQYGGLNKSAAIGLSTAITDKPIYFKTGEHAKAEFTLSRNARLQTRVRNTVYVAVAEHGGTKAFPQVREVYSNIGQYDDYADKDEVYRDIDVSIKQDITVLKDGNDYFKFTPQYSGYYTLKTYEDKFTEIEVWKASGKRENSEKSYNKQNNEVKVWLDEGSEYRIRVASSHKEAHDTFNFWIEFSPPNLGVDKPSATFTLKPQEYIFFEFTPETAKPYMIKTHEKFEIRVYDEYLNPIFDYNGVPDKDYIRHGEINALFRKSLNKRYYVEIKNTQNADTGETITSQVQAFAPVLLELNEPEPLDVLRAESAAYYSFTPEYSGNYKFSSSKINALSVHSNSDTLFLLKNSNQNYLEYFLIENTTYYFKITNTNTNKDNSAIYSSVQSISLNPLSVKFGENKVFNEQEYTFYSFKVSMDGEYSLSSSMDNTFFSIYDFNLNPIEINGDYYALSKNELYYIRQQDDGKMFEAVTLIIGLKAERLTLNNEENLTLNDSGYTNLKFTAIAEGYYSFNANCKIEIYSNDLTLLWQGNNSIRANMFAGREYYVHLSGEADETVFFKTVFDPDHIDLNTTNAISGNVQSKFFQYISESDNLHTVYTFGDLDIKTKIIIYDESLGEIYSFNNGGHANFKYNFSLGEKYYIEVIRNSGVGPFGFKIEELSVQNGYAVILEGEKLDGPDSSFNSKNFKFIATKTADFEIRLSKNRYDNFIIKVYNASGELQTIKSQNDRSFGETEIMKVYTYYLIAGTEYIIMIDSVNVDVKAPVLTVVVPATSFKVAFEGEILENTNQVIHVKQLNNYKLTISTNEWASLFEPVLTFDKPSSIGYFEWDGQYIIDFSVFEFAPVNHTISLLIEIDGIKFSILTFMIDYRYDLAGKTITDEASGKAEYEIFKSNDSEGSEIKNLKGLLKTITEVKYLDGTPLYVLPSESFKFDLSKLNYDKNIKIITTLIFEQEYCINNITYVNRFEIIIETGHAYNADYTSLADLVAAIDKKLITKSVVFVSLANLTNNTGKTITIPACVEVLNIKGVKGYNFTNVRFETVARTTELTLNFADFSFAAPASTVSINCTAPDLTLNIIGVCGIAGGAGNSGNSTSGVHGGNGITANNLNINGTLAGLDSLTITGGKGGDGLGTYLKSVYNPSGMSYSYETASMYGGNGGRGISCNNLITNISGLTVTGGSGGIGAVNDGTNGADKPKNNAGKGATGDNGTDGLTGGNGGDGGYGIVCTSLVNQSGSSIIIRGGNGGNAGRGGNGGAGGKGGDGHDSDMWNSAGNGGDGGNGGKGSDGGNGGNAGKAISLSSCAGATLLNSSGGSAGAKGTGGGGGAGGKGGNGFWSHGADGKTGVKGSDGKAGTSGTNVTYP